MTLRVQALDLGLYDVDHLTVHLSSMSISDVKATSAFPPRPPGVWPYFPNVTWVPIEPPPTRTCPRPEPPRTTATGPLRSKGDEWHFHREYMGDSNVFSLVYRLLSIWHPAGGIKVPGHACPPTTPPNKYHPTSGGFVGFTAKPGPEWCGSRLEHESHGTYLVPQGPAPWNVQRWLETVPLAAFDFDFSAPDYGVLKLLWKDAPTRDSPRMVCRTRRCVQDRKKGGVALGVVLPATAEVFQILIQLEEWEEKRTYAARGWRGFVLASARTGAAMTRIFERDGHAPIRGWQYSAAPTW